MSFDQIFRVIEKVYDEATAPPKPILSPIKPGEPEIVSLLNTIFVSLYGDKKEIQNFQCNS
jgi:hypothetical protein